MDAATQPQKVRLANVTEAAAYLRLSRSKLYGMMETGELRYVKIGTARRVRWDDLEELVERSTMGGWSQQPGN